jgi:hypothetical protein
LPSRQLNLPAGGRAACVIPPPVGHPDGGGVSVRTIL